ncbi:MAG: DUF4139 domain-containing protein [Inhella sp.]
MAKRWQLSVLAVALPAWVGAQGQIREVLVYPGGAEVRRVQAVAAGVQEVVFTCIPARIDLDSLQARGSGSLRVGELSVLTESSEAVPACSGQPQLDAQIGALEDDRAGLQAERAALDLVLGYLKQSGDAKLPAQAATAESLRRQGLEALRQQHQLQRRIEAVERQLKPLLAQREAARGGVRSWHRVTVRVSGQGELSLIARTPHAGWQPVYRAELNSDAARVAFERRAEVQQTTGESWQDVQLRLSTRQPQRASSPPEPQPWLLSKLEPVVMDATPKLAYQAALAMRTAQARAEDRADASLPSFQTDFDLQFTVPGRVSLASGQERRGYPLELLSWPAQVHTLVQPALQSQAFVQATVKRPEGFFPGGKLLLVRDGEQVGEGFFQPTDEAEQRLYFGPDDRLRVRVEPEQRDAGSGGLVGNRRVITLSRRYLLENLGGKPLQLQVLEAGAHAQHEDIRVEASFEPAIGAPRWREIDGLRAWSLLLAPGQQQRLNATYRLSAPRDMQVLGWP